MKAMESGASLKNPKRRGTHATMAPLPQPDGGTMTVNTEPLKASKRRLADLPPTLATGMTDGGIASKNARPPTASNGAPASHNGDRVAAGNMERLLNALVELKKGNFSARMPASWTGLEGKIADTFNDVIELNQRMAAELERMSRVVGKEGKISQRATIGEVTGSWDASIQSVNALVGDLVSPTRETARVIGAVAKGDLSQTMEFEVEGRPLQGEFLRTAKTVNTMVEQLGSFASEVTRVAREVGTEGKLGGQAQVRGVAGTWKDLTDNVNLMASNLTSQ